MGMRSEADWIIAQTIKDVLPDQAVRHALDSFCDPVGKLIVVAVGKAAYAMSAAAEDVLHDRITEGICITKYGHVMGELDHIQCYEAGHPILDEQTVYATKKAEQMVSDLTEDDLVLFLVSGGGSALFEDPCISLQELQQITDQLLRRGADITEINTIRKRLSKVKGGRFAQLCAPAKILTIVLSDVLSNRLDVIASGPAYPDQSTVKEAMEVVERYRLTISDQARQYLETETPKFLNHVETMITGSVKELCLAAAHYCQVLGYETEILSDQEDGEASELGKRLGLLARETVGEKAYIVGGETVVHVKGNGLGGRNQEIAVSAAKYLAGLSGCALFSIGSDGTDGPTDAAGGYVDGTTQSKFNQLGISIDEVLADNDAYHALDAVGGLIKTGPTGTNVNDVTVLLLDR